MSWRWLMPPYFAIQKVAMNAVGIRSGRLSAIESSMRFVFSS